MLVSKSPEIPRFRFMESTEKPHDTLLNYRCEGAYQLSVKQRLCLHVSYDEEKVYNTAMPMQSLSSCQCQNQHTECAFKPWI